MKLILIFNPNAGHKRSRKLLPQIESYLKQNDITFDLLLTESPGHATELVKDVPFEEYDGVISAGGDGTLFEVVNGYFQNKSKKRIPLGVLPVGTGNAFARDLDLTNDKWKEGIDIFAANKPRKVDVGHFKTRDNEYYYLNILGMGFVSDVTKTAYGIKTLGNISYTLGVFYQMAFLKSHKLQIEIDGELGFYKEQVRRFGKRIKDIT